MSAREVEQQREMSTFRALGQATFTPNSPPMINRRFAAFLVATALACDASERAAQRDTLRDSLRPPAPAAADSGRDSTAWTVTESGYGPLHAGVSVGDAARMLGEPLSVAGADTACGYADPATLPAGVLLMVTSGTLARVDIWSRTVKTAPGAGVGDSEARIDSLYRGRVTVEPHEYTDGHYLVVRSASRATPEYRIIFETDGAVVTRYRAGRMPEVSWVEGCS